MSTACHICPQCGLRVDCAAPAAPARDPDARIAELLAANNALLERARAAEARTKRLVDVLTHVHTVMEMIAHAAHETSEVTDQQFAAAFNSASEACATLLNELAA